MKIIAKKTALLLSLTALASTTAAFGFAKKADFAPTAPTAYAQTAQTLTAKRANDERSQLIAPDSYQQYLSLNAPMDVAANGDYMAIADNNLIYVYDVEDGEYRQYEHTLNQADPTKNDVMELQFYGNDQLYFLDGTYLYLLNPETLQVSNVSLTENHPKFPCSSFLIVDDVLYYTDVKTQASVSYITMDGTKADTLDTVDGKPTIAFWEGELYYTEAAKYLRKVDPQTEEDALVADFADDLVSMQIKDNVFVCTTLSGDFYAYNLSELASAHSAKNVTPLAHYQGDYSSLALFGEYVYAVNGASVCQYSLENSAFTDFEICNASDSIHRLDDGVGTLLLGDTLFIADNGNGRISVYDTKNERFNSPISLDFSPKYLAGDENTLLAADGTQAVLLDLTAENYGEAKARFNAFNGTLVGAANVYGKYYFATDSNYYYVAQEQESETDGTLQKTWTLSESKKTSTRYAKLLTADAYGYLYVASGNGVYRFSEEGFMETATEGETLGVTLPTATERILIDYDGGVYALAGGKLQKATSPAPYALNDPPVYSETATIQSFAFGIEDNITYVLYKENFLIKTDVLDLPTVKNIPVNGVDSGIFDAAPATVEIVKLRSNSMLIDFDLAALSGAEVFPYLDYSRYEKDLTALKIGETVGGKHAILVFYDKEMRTYRACLALTGDCLALTKEELNEHYKTKEPTTMFVSNAVPVYKFPHLSGLPTATELARNAKITVLGEVNNLDHSYYYVEYTDGGVTHTGYVPKAYVINFDPTPRPPQENVYGKTESDKDSVRRLTLLLMGGAAILILTDVLIFRALRKKKDD